MRKRFNTARVCSSDNYELSKRISTSKVDISNNTHKKAYAKCFDALVPITLEQAEKMKNDITIIYM